MIYQLKNRFIEVEPFRPGDEDQMRRFGIVKNKYWCPEATRGDMVCFPEYTEYYIYDNADGFRYNLYSWTLLARQNGRSFTITQSELDARYDPKD